MSLMKRKSNWPSINKWLKCFVKLATALFNLLRNTKKIVPIVIWQQMQLYDISNHVGMTSILTINYLNSHYTLQLYTYQ